jgi:hypothetical protein
MTRLALLLTLAALTLGLAACGAGAGSAPKEVHLTATDGFGRETLIERRGPEVRGSDTVMRLLQRNAKVTTRYGGGFVQSIDGVKGGRDQGRPMDWFYYVNGVLAEKGAASTKVRPGDRIWWDRHDWGASMDVRAVVGSFPEPFLHGMGGKRLTTRMECDEQVEAACDIAAKKLGDLGVVVPRSRPLTDGGAENLRVVVGLWPNLHEDRALRMMADGPKASGVFARFSADGKTLIALDARGRAVRRLGPGTGLVAALRYDVQAPTWAILGTDAAGVEAAAAALDETILAEKFALAISGGLPVALPVAERG